MIKKRIEERYVRKEELRSFDDERSVRMEKELMILVFSLYDGGVVKYY